ncbi:hypothetical protein BT96DRAFT_998909 [Gymnopus androsaceus JB14]|uniref:Uncharacterized protein n=1 Tax=Gymnopus androsaceus JB14 TaxID=1447944 RepID=A0A6A4H7F2_9AGAR|nr:hypothetical protein BT96DRAFT_998909 [Gymnopus androsaceus JB14]
MASLNAEHVFSFLRQNPTLLAQLVSPQLPQPSATPALAQPDIISPQPLQLHSVQQSAVAHVQPPAPLPPVAAPLCLPPSQPVAYPLPVPAAPIRPYSSLNMLAGTVISRANQEQLEHATSLGDSSSTSEKRKTRKKGKHAPALQGPVTPTINHTLNTAEDGTVLVNLEILIRFAMPNCLDQKELGLPNSFYHYSRHMSSFKTVLRSLGLLHTFDNLPVTTQQWSYQQQRQNTKLISAFVDDGMTLADIVYDTRQFAIARHVVTPQNRFTLHFAIRSGETIFEVNPNENDIDAKLDRNYEALDEEAIENHCAASDSSDKEDTAVAQLIILQSTEPGSLNTATASLSMPDSGADAASSVASNTSPSIPTSSATSSAATGTVARSALAEIQAAVTVPVAKLWESAYISPPCLDALPGFFGFERKVHIFNAVSIQYHELNNVRGEKPRESERPRTVVETYSAADVAEEMNFSVSSLTNCSEQFHVSLAWTMLHNAIVGSAPVKHPYFQAFLEGFKLPCKGLFNLLQIAHSYFGNVSDFVLELMETTIKSFADLRLIIREDIGEQEKRALNNAFTGVGAPSAGILDMVQYRYSAMDTPDHSRQGLVFPDDQATCPTWLEFVFLMSLDAFVFGDINTMSLAQTPSGTMTVITGS